MINDEWIEFFNNDDNVLPISNSFVILDNPYYAKAKVDSYNFNNNNLSSELNEFIYFWHERFNLTNNLV